MIADDRQDVRQLGLQRILMARSEKRGDVIRTFTIPKLNFDTTDYIDMIDWFDTPITSTPLLSRISDATIRSCIQGVNADILPVIRVPCHTQAVERCLKLVTEASQAVCGRESRDGYIELLLRSRQQMPSSNSKSSYTTD